MSWLDKLLGRESYSPELYDRRPSAGLSADPPHSGASRREETLVVRLSDA